MEGFLKEFKAYRPIYILIIIGLSLFMVSTTIIYSIYKQCESNIEFKHNGKFKSVYSLNIKKYNDISFKDIDKLAKKNLNNCSILTDEIVIGADDEIMIGIFNYEMWTPSLVDIIDSGSIEEDEIILGKELFYDKTEIQLDSEVYNVGAIAGLKDENSIYDRKIYIPLNLLPSKMELALKENGEINILVRSNDNIKKQLNLFIDELKNLNHDVEINVKRLNFQYIKEAVSNGGAREAFSFPLRVILITAINGILLIYFFNYIQRRKIALEKTLGGNNLIITINIFLKLILCIIPASIISAIFTYILIKVNSSAIGMEIVFGIPSIIVGIICSCLICILTSIISYFNIAKIEPVKTLK